MTKKELYKLYKEAQKMPIFSYIQEARANEIIENIKNELFNNFIKEMEETERKEEIR